MDDLNPLLIAIVPAFLTYLGTRYKFQNEREQYASSEWKKLYEETKQQLGKNKVRMDGMQEEMIALRKQIDEMKAMHVKEVEKLEHQNTELKEENRQLRVENGNLKNQLIEKERGK